MARDLPVRNSILILWALVLIGASRSVAQAQSVTFPIEDSSKLRLQGVIAEPVFYEGRNAIRVTQSPDEANSGSSRLAVIPGSSFTDGVIEIEMAGRPQANAPGAARGFVGIAFRVAEDLSQYELIYLRPTNGRAEDQLRRNHSVQYDSFPDYPWHRLRRESPGNYESYADLQPGDWTKVKIVISGANARLFLHGADQPCLVVGDLKLGAAEGGIALWIGPGTEAHFANLRFTPLSANKGD